MLTLNIYKSGISVQNTKLILESKTLTLEIF